MARHDFAYPFRISGTSGQAAQSAYPDHVDQMIRQVLLTDPGERVCMPEFGCGLRRLIFAPHSDALQATTNLLVLQSLQRWLSLHIEVKKVTVSKPDEFPEGQFVVLIEYVLRETQTPSQAEVRVF
ncbi:MAG TPA: GPW/gp25 family protein [Vicinamibacteria bacterium]|jgi:phage baseplate assembly protein W|nr:GPW/gp25 family protein [Vicinamibacteria bacterium]